MWRRAFEAVDWKEMQYARSPAATPCSLRKNTLRWNIFWSRCLNCYELRKFVDGSSLSTYKVAEGSKIHLFTKKIDDGPRRSGLDIALFNALKSHLSKEDIDKVVTEFNKELQTAFTNYSMDDIERLATNLLR